MVPIKVQQIFVVTSFSAMEKWYSLKAALLEKPSMTQDGKFSHRHRFSGLIYVD
jgi:hypothetical protein